MSDIEPPEFLSRIAERCAALGLSESAASTAAFGHHKGISHLKAGTKSPGIDFFTKLAAVLQVSPAWLAYGAGETRPTLAPAARLTRLPYVGEVAAGQWLDQETHFDVSPSKVVGLTANPRWPADAQFVVGVRGTSIDRVAPDGALLACVDPRRIRYHAQNGDLVIVERRRFGGGEIERTAKRYRQVEDYFELWPDSTDPAHKPIIIDPHEPEEGTSIEIVGLVDRFVHSIGPDQPWNRNALDQ